jgi:hypothetical protein
LAKVLALSVVAAIAVVGLQGSPATATPSYPGSSQPLLIAQNQSDVTGGNSGDLPAPIVPGEVPVIDQATVDVARQLADDLDDAYAKCLESREALRNAPRRFALGPEPEICITQECEYLNQVMEEARIFLNSLSTAEQEALRESYSLQLW